MGSDKGSPTAQSLFHKEKLGPRGESRAIGPGVSTLSDLSLTPGRRQALDSFFLISAFVSGDGFDRL